MAPSAKPSYNPTLSRQRRRNLQFITVIQKVPNNPHLSSSLFAGGKKLHFKVSIQTRRLQKCGPRGNVLEEAFLEGERERERSLESRLFTFTL